MYWHAIPVLINSTEHEIRCKFTTHGLQDFIKYVKYNYAQDCIIEIVISVIEKIFNIQIIISFHFNFISFCHIDNYNAF